MEFFRRRREAPNTDTAPAAEADTVTQPPAPPAQSDLEAGLERTRQSFMRRLRGFLGPADETSWDDVEEALIAADVGATLATEVVERARRRRDPAGAEAAVRAELARLLVPRDLTWSPRPSVEGGPAVILVVGVNGTGKTTTIGKLAARYVAEGRSVVLAAADTFRAAAIEQLRVWAERADVAVVAHAPGADPGAVVFDAIDAAVARGADIVIADTAGRLHTKSNLMDELRKVRRIIDRRLPGAQPETLFILDATTGQNGLAQARAFHEAVGLTGIVLTKLDSTARGGIVFAIEDALKVPVRFVGVGEKAADLLPFDPDAFVAALFA
jgi:fused signal recognition particle receptor